MTPELINRYQPGGDIYGTLASQYGATAAASIAAAARTGDETQINAALVQVKNGQPLNDSTWSIFANQLATDPLAAPLAGADRILSNSFVAFLKSPAVLATVAVVLFLSLGGLDWLKNKLKK